jgi:hypothetical protein
VKLSTGEMDKRVVLKLINMEQEIEAIISADNFWEEISQIGLVNGSGIT